MCCGALGKASTPPKAPGPWALPRQQTVPAPAATHPLSPLPASIVIDRLTAADTELKFIRGHRCGADFPDTPLPACAAPFAAPPLPVPRVESLRWRRKNGRCQPALCAAIQFTPCFLISDLVMNVAEELDETIVKSFRMFSNDSDNSLRFRWQPLVRTDNTSAVPGVHACLSARGKVIMTCVCFSRSRSTDRGRRAHQDCGPIGIRPE